MKRIPDLAPSLSDAAEFLRLSREHRKITTRIAAIDKKLAIIKKETEADNWKDTDHEQP